MKPIWSRRISVSPASSSEPISRSPTKVRPEVGVSRPAMQCIRVDLPDPDGPMTAVKRPVLELDGDPAEGMHDRVALAVGLHQVDGVRRRWRRVRGGDFPLLVDHDVSPCRDSDNGPALRGAHAHRPAGVRRRQRVAAFTPPQKFSISGGGTGRVGLTLREQYGGDVPWLASERQVVPVPPSQPIPQGWLIRRARSAGTARPRPQLP